MLVYPLNVAIMSTVVTPTAPHGHDAQLASALDRKGANGRRSSPDSEAITSSDDEHESAIGMSLSLHSAKSMPAQKPMRRSSWLSDVHSSSGRKFSLGGGTPLAPVTGSQPPTPSAENGSLASGPFYAARTGNGINATPSPSWERESASGSQTWGMGAVGSSSGRPSTGHSSFNWNSPIWQQQKSNTRPSLPSPSASSTSTHVSSHLPPSQNQGGSLHSPQMTAQGVKQTNMSNAALSPTFNPIWGASLSQEQSLPNQNIHSPTLSSQSDYHSPSSSTFEHAVGTTPALPFEIPLEPNRKTIRSQSYSSGSTRGPIIRRPSRPSILSVMDTVNAEPEFVEEAADDFQRLDRSRTFAAPETGDRNLDNEMAETALSAQSAAAFARSTLDAASQDHIRSQVPPSIFENRQEANRLWNASLIGNIPEEEHESSPHDMVHSRHNIGHRPSVEFMPDAEEGKQLKCQVVNRINKTRRLLQRQ
jgi:hypothetical protein